MARTAGDTNLTLREKRKDAQIEELKTKLAAAKAGKKVEAARMREFREKLKVAK